MRILYNLVSLSSDFFVMIIFLIIAIIFGKSKWAWAWYIIGAVVQLLAVLGSQKVANMRGVDNSLLWLVYYLLLLAAAGVIIVRYINANIDDASEAETESVYESKMDDNDGYKTLNIDNRYSAVTHSNNRNIKEEDIEIIRPKVVKKVNVSSKVIRLDDKVKQDVVKNDITDHNNESKKQLTMEENKVLGAEQEIAFCRKCGTQLLWDSKFCHKCGCEKVH